MNNKQPKSENINKFKTKINEIFNKLSLFLKEIKNETCYTDLQSLNTGIFIGTYTGCDWLLHVPTNTKTDQNYTENLVHVFSSPKNYQGGQ